MNALPKWVLANPFPAIHDFEFLRVGTHRDPEPQPGDPPKEKPKFEDLFNERGGIK